MHWAPQAMLTESLSEACRAHPELQCKLCHAVNSCEDSFLLAGAGKSLPCICLEGLGSVEAGTYQYSASA